MGSANAQWRGMGCNGNRKRLWAILLLFVLMLCVSPQAFAAASSMDPPPLKDDPRWEQIRDLWARHYRGNNLDELISLATAAKDSNPASVEPYLWLARLHHLHARYHSRQRTYHYDMAEQYAARACAMEPKHPLAVKALVDTLFHCRDRDYILGKYGSLIKSFAPLPLEEALPDMESMEEWQDFKPLWDGRTDVEKAKTATAMVERMARENPSNALAHIWASMANNYVGEYYLSVDRYDDGRPYYKAGIEWAEKALALAPDSVPASFWLEFNITRTIQNKWLIMKGQYLMTLLPPTLFCSREESLYYQAGPMLSLGVMIANGGWVTEKGMDMAGVTADMNLNALELAGILYPDYIFIPYQRADILASKGRTREAMAILAEVLSKYTGSEGQVPENHVYFRLAKALYAKLEKKMPKKGSSDD